MKSLALTGACLLALAAFLLPAYAADPTPLFPSPDGRFVILQSDDAGQPAAAIADKASGKILRAVMQLGGTLGSVLWKPESDRVALIISTSRFEYSLCVYVHQGDTFEGIDLPELPAATIPAKYGPNTKLKHWSSQDAPYPVRWLKDGSLLVKITSTADNANTADDRQIEVTATRTVVISFPAGKKPRILSSTLKVTTHHD